MTNFMLHIYSLSLIYTILIALIVFLDEDVREAMCVDTLKEKISFLSLCVLPFLNFIVIAVFVYTVFKMDKAKQENEKL